MVIFKKKCPNCSAELDTANYISLIFFGVMRCKNCNKSAQTKDINSMLSAFIWGALSTYIGFFVLSADVIEIFVGFLIGFFAIHRPITMIPTLEKCHLNDS